MDPSYVDPEGSVSSLGEFGLIDGIVSRLGQRHARTLVGAGEDDAAVLEVGGLLQLATLDALVDGTHFERARIAPRVLGRRLAAVNLSDVAAMGGRPTHALAGLVAPPDLPARYALDVVEGLVEQLARFGADLVGGNVSRGDRLVLDLALLGEVGPDRLLLRSGARPGDVVMVTGALGGAAAARAARAAEPESTGIPADDLTAVDLRLDDPEPRLSVAPLLRPGGATAAIDVSDGLAADVGHLCDRSGVGVRIEAVRLPVDTSAATVARALGADALAWALAGGEDYELLVTVDPRRAAALSQRVLEAAGLALTAVGEVTADAERRLILADGRRIALGGGWRHFGST